MNIKKTHVMNFGRKHTSTPNIKINNILLETIKETKFLGMIIDSNLTWKNHVSYTSKKIAKSIGVLSRARQFLSQKSLLQIYYSFIYPNLIYGNIIWGNTAACNIWPIYKLQKIAIRLITNTKKGNSTLALSKSLKIFRLPDIYLLNTSVFMYKYHHKMLPDALAPLFHRNNAIHTHNTRNANKLRAPRIQSYTAEKFITHAGVKNWNEISETINPNQKIGAFKRSVAKHLIDKYA
jgi:hypothetical protein